MKSLLVLELQQDRLVWQERGELKSLTLERFVLGTFMLATLRSAAPSPKANLHPYVEPARRDCPFMARAEKVWHK
jgi:hypothetical protein